VSTRLPILPSGSELPRALRCPGSCVLPQVRQEPGEPAANGNAVHAFLEDIHNGMTPEDAITRVPVEHQAACRAIHLDALPSRMLELTARHAEITLAYNVDTGKTRYLGSGLRRDYSKADRTCEIVLTLDLVAVDKSNHHWVWDWKTGWGAEKVEPATNNPQLWAGGLAWSRARDVTSVTVGPVRITEQGFVDGTDTHTMDALDLDAFEAQLRAMVERVRALEERMHSTERVPDVHEGHWCSGCPAFLACPAKRALLLQATGGGLGDVTPVTQEQRAAAHQRWRDLVVLAEQAEKEVKEDARLHGMISLGNGLVFEEREVGTSGKKRFGVYREARKAS
jgi:hypothetical protein